MAQIVGAFPSEETETYDMRELEKLLGWRMDQLAQAGFDMRTAVILANRRDVDLHVACDLAGAAGPAVAARILL
ncbi:MAG: hypothetical protein ACYC9L_05450 [Sulfuricaulis sp.]